MADETGNLQWPLLVFSVTFLPCVSPRLGSHGSALFLRVRSRLFVAAGTDPEDLDEYSRQRYHPGSSSSYRPRGALHLAPDCPSM